MKTKEENYFSYEKENEGRVDFYMLEQGISICFNQIYTNNWTKGDSALFSKQMLILNFCINGRCDASLVQNRYAIVKEHQVCVSTFLPTKDFYYPNRLYEGIQIYIDRDYIKDTKGMDLLSKLGVNIEKFVEIFCGKDGLYMHQMNDSLLELVKEVWKMKEEPEFGMLRYLTVRILHELMKMPQKSERATRFTKSQIAIVKEAETIIMHDLSKRITAREMADRFGISESSFKLYVKGILGDGYLAYFRKKRMEKAAELLRDTNLKVIEIANSIGYENQGKFAKVFAELYGVSPLEYRRLSKKE